MAEETAGDKENDSCCSTQSRVKQPELCRWYFFEKAADPADEVVRGKQVEIKDADNRGRQCSGRDTRIERERNRKDVRKANAVEHVKGDEPADRNFSSGTRRDHCANCERDETVDSHEAADADLRNFRWLRKLFRPESPEHHRAGEETYRHDRIERDQPCRRHLAAEKDEVRVVLCPNEIRVENLLVTDDCNRQHRQKRDQCDDRHFFTMGQRNSRGALALSYNGRIGRQPFPAGAINRQADQHADTCSTESIMPAVNFAECACYQWRRVYYSIDRDVVNLKC